MIRIDCDLCGAKTNLLRTVIESTEMTVCRDCSRFGKIIGEVKEKGPEKVREQKPLPSSAEMFQIIVEDYAEKIKTGREHLNLTQEEFAKKLSEKESIIHKMEIGSFEPNMSLARKLEKFLKIRLFEQHEEKHEKAASSKSENFTIGDFIKIKKK